MAVPANSWMNTVHEFPALSVIQAFSHYVGFAKRTENQTMTVYVAILSSRKLNMPALENAGELVKESVRPIIEVAAGDNGTEIKAVANRVVEYVRKSNPDGRIDLVLDTAPLAGGFGPEGAPPSSTRCAIRDCFSTSSTRSECPSSRQISSWTAAM
ncbi:hypothetical protein ACFYUK_00050 [Nonomuraea wenchangensis]